MMKGTGTSAPTLRVWCEGKNRKSERIKDGDARQRERAAVRTLGL